MRAATDPSRPMTLGCITGGRADTRVTRGRADAVPWTGGTSWRGSLPVDARSDASEVHRQPDPRVRVRANPVASRSSDREGERHVRPRRHHRAMPWESFDMQDVDVRTMRGYGRIGRAVRRRCERIGLPQRDLHRLFGIDQSVISRLETGQLRGLRFSRLARLVDALGGIGDADPLPAWATPYRPTSRNGPGPVAQAGP